MHLVTTERIFDTHLDTLSNVSKMNTSFKLRTDLLKNGKNPIYIHITGNSKREFINTGLYVFSKDWNPDKQRAKPKDKEHSDLNLILDKCESKLHEIKVSYRLTGLVPTPNMVKKEYLNNLSRINFIAFSLEAIKLESTISPERINGLRSIINKVSEYSSFVRFHEMDANWFKNYRLWLKKVKKNNEITISTNIKAIKKFLRLAQKSGIQLPISLDEIKPGNTKGNRNYLSEAEIKKLVALYFSDDIIEKNKLILGYFLFGCMTGLRISNIQKLNREDFQNGQFSVVMVKGNKDKILSLNATAQRIIEHNENLFIKKYSDQELNRKIKSILTNQGITKKISFHCARHTFATLFLKNSGRVELLQQLLGHSSIKQTMIYSHIVQEDANREIFCLDKLF
jgi:site-specific recombinase XerD